MLSVLGLSLLLGVFGQDQRMPESPAVRLEYMKKSLADYQVQSRQEPGQGQGQGQATDRLLADPVLRFTNPVGGSKDGCVFLWLGENDRPSAAVQVYWNPGQRFLQELSSLSTTPLIARSNDAGDWSPSRPGVEFQAIPDAPKPADTPERRLRQMSSLAEGFSARHHYMGKTWNQLRLMTKPFHRYGKADSTVLDGALYCFAHGTDPEVLLMIEARTGKNGLEWQFALAPMTTFQINAFWKDKEIWSKEAQGNGSAGNPTNTFHVRRYSAPGE